MSNLKKNSFITFNIGRNKAYGIVKSVNTEFALVIFYNGFKIDKIHKKLNSCKEITKEQFRDLVMKNNATAASWYSLTGSIQSLYGINTFLESETEIVK